MRRSGRWSYLWLILLLTGVLCLVQAPESHAQQKGKTEYEKRNERKNRKNRRLKRKKEDAKSNRRERRMFRFKARTKQGDKAHRGDIAGRRLIPKSSGRSRVVYPRPNPYAGRKMSETRRVKFFRSSPRYSQRRRERAGKGSIYSAGSLRTTFAGKNAYKFQPAQSASRPTERVKKTKRIVPRSASGAYIRNKKKNPYAWRERSEWESAHKGNIAGRKFRLKRTTDRPSIQGPPSFKNRRTTRRGDQPYSGRAKPRGNMSATRPPERAGRRAGKYGSQLSATRRGEKAYSGRAFPRKDISVTKGGEKAGRRSVYKAGSVQTTFTGKKAYKFKPWQSASKPTETPHRKRIVPRSTSPMYGGGGGRHNNRGRSLQNRGVRSQDIRVAKHSGNIRTTRGLEGGGSISAKMRRNNDGKPVRGFGPGRQDNQIARYQGNLRFGGRPPKNKGNSLSRARWNNDGKAIRSRDASHQDINIAAFKGNSKGPRKSPKGAGGSVSVLPWNNDGEPLQQLVPGKDTRVATSFQGTQKRSFRYVKNPSAADESLRVKPVGKGTTQAMSYQGSMKRRFRYTKNPNSAEGALKGIGPSRAMVQASQYQGNIKMSKKRYKNRHPSHKFEDQSRTARNERKNFSLKVWWSKLFRKQENQPVNLKEKERKPRFDKGEKGLWND